MKEAIVALLSVILVAFIFMIVGAKLERVRQSELINQGIVCPTCKGTGQVKPLPTQIPLNIQSREVQLRIVLAALLPDLIEITDSQQFKWLTGSYRGLLLRDTEWEHVLSIVKSRHRHVKIELN